MAGNTVRLKVTGVQELVAAARAYGQAVITDARAAVDAAVMGTARDAQAAAPVETGELRDSIGGSVTIDPYGAVGEVRARAYYASFVEFGTEDTPKHPFFIAAAIRHRRNLTRAQIASVQRRAPDGLGRPRITGDGPGLPDLSGGEG